MFFCNLKIEIENKFKQFIKDNFKNIEYIEKLLVPPYRLDFYMKDVVKNKMPFGIPLSILTYEIFNNTFLKYDEVVYMDADLQFLKKSNNLFNSQFNHHILVFPDIGFNYVEKKKIYSFTT